MSSKSDRTNMVASNYSHRHELPHITDRYVCGFAFAWFSNGRCLVALIKKTSGKPHLIGKLNGIGGAIKSGESPIRAMVREFREEAGIHMHQTMWNKFAMVQYYNVQQQYHGRIHFFRAFVEYPRLERAKRVSDEGPINLYGAHDLPKDVMPNLQFLIPLALNPIIDNIPFFQQVEDGRSV